MSVSLLECLESCGYKVTANLEDAAWLLSKQREIEELIKTAELMISLEEERLSAIAEDEYQERFGNE